MSSYAERTDMGKAQTSSENQKGSITDVKPPDYISNKTNNSQYNDELRTWANIMRSFARADSKGKTRVGMVGILVYLAYDEEANEKIRAEETEKMLNLREGSGDGGRDERVIIDYPDGQTTYLRCVRQGLFVMCYI